MTIQLAEITLDPPVLLAPLAGITDLPFRNLVAGFGAGLVVSEMVASQEIVQARASARARAELGFDRAGSAGQIAVQIAGREAFWMAEAARICEANGAKIIDINMGCPAKRVTNGESGSALMKDPDHALALIEAVLNAVSVPVTLKTRLGWDAASINIAGLARRAQDAGIAMLTVHARTRCQFYNGRPDWGKIASVAKELTIPVVVNGDIIDAGSARRALACSGASGVMVGRGARGAPWRLAEIAHDVFGAPAPKIPSGGAFADMIEAHYQAMLRFYGPQLGLRVARKHLGWYLDGLETPPKARRAVLTLEQPKKVVSLIRAICADSPALRPDLRPDLRAA